MQNFKLGFRAMLPLAPGILPFGAVMGSTFAEANLTFDQSMLMNASVYAGAAQLATVNLMKLNAAVFVVVITGLMINMRFLLYSAAISPQLKGEPWWIKFACAFTLTDQSYATMTAKADLFSNNHQAIRFYLGSALAMGLTWHGSVIAGVIFGNFAPASLSLDYAVPLSFVALLVPTLKTRGHRVLAVFSSLVSLLMYGLPFKAGLIVTAILSMGLAAVIIRRRGHA